MSQYILKRILIAIPTTLDALTFIFFTMRILPGDPAVARWGEAATPKTLAEMRQLLGLDPSLIVQSGALHAWHDRHRTGPRGALGDLVRWPAVDLLPTRGDPVPCRGRTQLGAATPHLD